MLSVPYSRLTRTEGMAARAVAVLCAALTVVICCFAGSSQQRFSNPLQTVPTTFGDTAVDETRALTRLPHQAAPQTPSPSSVSKAPHPSRHSSSPVPSLDDLPFFNVTAESRGMHFFAYRQNVCSAGAASNEEIVDVTLAQVRDVKCPVAGRSAAAIRDAKVGGVARPPSPTNFQQSTDWVMQQYAGYAKKCAKKKGVMWKKLKPVDHDGVAKVMFDTAFAGLMTKDRKSVAVLDWASGCGADTAAYRRLAWERKLDFHSIGVDIVDAAVNWARDHAAELFADGDAQRAAAAQDTHNTFRYCAADGSDLSWVPSRSVDAILSLSGLTHVPTPYLCRTVAHYARVLKPRSRAVACYLHLPHAVDVLGNCTVDCAANGVQGSFVMSRFKMNDFFGKEWPEWYRKIHSDCIVWERLG
jgi:hypothetical protein